MWYDEWNEIDTLLYNYFELIFTFGKSFPGDETSINQLVIIQSLITVLHLSGNEMVENITGVCVSVLYTGIQCMGRDTHINCSLATGD